MMTWQEVVVFAVVFAVLIVGWWLVDDYFQRPGPFGP